MGPQERAGSPEPARARGVVPRDRQSSHGTSAPRIPEPPFLRARVPTESPQFRVRRGDPHKNPTDNCIKVPVRAAQGAGCQGVPAGGQLVSPALGLGALAAVALQHLDAHLAARFVGAAAAARAIGVTPWPSVIEAEDRVIRRIRAALPEAEFTADVAEGRTDTGKAALAAAWAALEDGAEAQAEPGS